ncbi:SubName: Full=Uncharacterized protein {ECO:0000313/EMBL:CCA71336.1} [Serendipita indica DSM 11827]|nr:SubName: Full=Uncharacterized protein {ECO:0000313/EMBL:CCA71336.1} [Serendipita indica DSM 11827]
MSQRRHRQLENDMDPPEASVEKSNWDEGNHREKPDAAARDQSVLASSVESNITQVPKKEVSSLPVCIPYPSAQEIRQKRPQVAQWNANYITLPSESRGTRQEILEFAPIRRLPLELLSTIISMHVEDHASVWEPMQVSKTWRSATLLVPNLWNSLLLCSPDWPNIKKAKEDRGRIGTYDVCCAEVHVRRALARTRSHFLNLQISSMTGDPRGPLSYSTQPTLRLISHLLEIIRTSLPARRVRNLTLDSKELPDTVFADWDFSMLEEIKTSNEYVFDKAIGESRSLTTLYVSSGLLPKLGPSANIGHITKIHMVDNAPLIGLSHCHFLTDLTVRALRGDGEIVAFPRLKRLHVSNLFTGWTIVCPNLVHLQITGTSGRSTWSGQVHLPQLRELVYFYALDVDSKLMCFDVPNLRVLKLAYGVTSYITIQALTKLWVNGGSTDSYRQHLDPQELIVKDIFIASETLCGILRHLTRCKELRLENVIRSSGFFQGMSTVSSEEKDEIRAANPPLPNLTNLIAEIRESPRVPPERILIAAKRLVQTRRELGIPLERLSIKTPGNEGWRELVQEGDCE